MKARITCDKDHALGKLFSQLFDVEYCSRQTGFDLHSITDVNLFLEKTCEYDWTINFSRGMPFGGVKLLCSLDEYCNSKKIKHKVLNIGSYISFALLNSPHSSYDVEKASLKFTHRKIAFAHMFHNGYIDSYIINLSHLEELSVDVGKEYTHLDLLSLQSVIDNVKFMLDNPTIKELSLQKKQPGNHRINDGIGLIIPGLY